MEIRIYSGADEAQLFDLMRAEGDDWACYFCAEAADKYKKAMLSSTTYVVFENNVLCGFLRCKDDFGLCVYIYDLLVDKAFRGHAIGRKLMERVCADFPEIPVFVLSGADTYYQKLGYKKEGSLFKVQIQ